MISNNYAVSRKKLYYTILVFVVIIQTSINTDKIITFSKSFSKTFKISCLLIVDRIVDTHVIGTDVSDTKCFETSNRSFSKMLELYWI